MHQAYRTGALADDDGALYDTLGTTGPTALTKSGIATGFKQAAINVGAEAIYDCPAQWLAEAFSSGGDRQAWRYQYSVTPSYHGADLSAIFPEGDAAEVPNADFRRSLQRIWGNFVVRGSPVISVADATAGYPNATVPLNGDGEGDIDWPPYAVDDPVHMTLNTTGGTVQNVTVTSDLSYLVRVGPGIVNNFSLADAVAWEGGRGQRCWFWRDVSERVPL